MLEAFRPLRTCAADMSVLPYLLGTTKAVAKCVVGGPLTESNKAPTYGTPSNCVAAHPLMARPSGIEPLACTRTNTSGCKLHGQCGDFSESRPGAVTLERARRWGERCFQGPECLDSRHSHRSRDSDVGRTMAMLRPYSDRLVRHGDGQSLRRPGFRLTIRRNTCADAQGPRSGIGLWSYGLPAR